LTDDLDALLGELAAPVDTTRTPLDRYREFRAVFLGTDQGQRVLHDILRFCRMRSTSIEGAPIDPYRTHVLEGQRNVGIWLTIVLYREPKELPSRQNSTVKEG